MGKTYIGNQPPQQTPVYPSAEAVHKNYIINPAFSVNQRGFAGGALTLSLYGIDRWRCGGLGDINVTYSAGEATITGAGLHQQPVEFLQGLAGKTVTLSWEGTSQANVYRATGDDINSRNNSPYTFVMPSTSLGVGIHEYIGFSAGTMKNVKLEVGSFATPFEPPETATELNKCRRYFQRIESPKMVGVGQVGASIARLGMPLDTTMRAIPNCIITGTVQLFNGVTVGTLVSAGAVFYNSINTVELDASASVSFGGGTCVVTYNGSYGIELVAEL